MLLMTSAHRVRVSFSDAEQTMEAFRGIEVKRLVSKRWSRLITVARPVGFCVGAGRTGSRRRGKSSGDDSNRQKETPRTYVRGGWAGGAPPSVDPLSMFSGKFPVKGEWNACASLRRWVQPISCN